MAALIQTIAVVDQSGKAVSTSKHLVNVFKEAKAAYRERKAEVVAGRQHREQRSPRALAPASTGEYRSALAPRKHSRHRKSKHRPSTDRRHSSNSIRSNSSTVYPSSHNRFSQELRSLTLPPDRRHSADDDDYDPPRPPALPARSMTSPSMPSCPIDMDLAYGPIPPPLPMARKVDEAEFRGLVQKVKRILEEADCLQYSATATIASLQRNPEAMAAVALTLAEISNIAKEVAPGVLMAMRGSAPAVFALLASPQFLIAGGVAVGVTIVAFGGYKIIKKIRARNALENPGMEEMLEVGGDVSTIDSWRRGIAEVEEQSVGTSVDGEFITPQAAALSRLTLNDERAEASSDSSRGSKKTSSSKVESETGSKASSKGSSRGSSKASSKEKKEKKVKKPSPLRPMVK